MRRSRTLWILIVVVLAACGADDDANVAAETPSTDPPAASSSCEGPERFAALLDGRGITVDYEPSDSPAELASHADAVFGGELTGRVFTSETVSSDDPNPRTFLGFEVEVTRVAKGADGVAVAQVVEVFVEFAPPSVPDLSDGDRDLVEPGTPVVVFAGRHPGLDELTALIPEGFMTECPGGPVLGQTGTQGQWRPLDRLDAVLDAVEADVPSSTTPTAPVGDTTTTTTPTTSTAVPPTSSGLPDRAATVTGTVGTDDAGRPGILEDASDHYFAGMGLRQGDPVVIDESTGEPVPFESLRSGEPISVWVDGPCAESFPVQCDVEAIAVHDRS